MPTRSTDGTGPRLPVEVDVTPPQRSLAILNALGGAAVLASYALAFRLAPDLQTGLWGGVPEALRGLYTTNMLLAAAGYFPVTVQWIFATDPGRFRIDHGRSYAILHLLYAAILIPSALWLPLTAELLRADSDALWWAVRGVLLAVAAGSTGLLWLCARRALGRGGVLAWLALAGAIPFWLQTAVLDALLWPAWFPR